MSANVFQRDHLGTPQKLVSPTGAVVWSAQVENATVTNNLRLPGQYYDAETGCIITGVGIMIRM